ncbi:MAG: proteinase inhibitor I4 serpin, partial [Oscillospiraceae bacterium]|nr:proteinase inhibitor I4 serpin [Oscillospiraceae bacterium]
GTVQKVQMMYSNNEYYYLEDAHATGFYKYYRGGDYAFAALLPEEGLSVDDYISGLTAESLQETLSNPVSIETHTVLPKFSYDYEITLNEALKEMGMPEAFTGAANFSKMTVSDDLYIGRVFHKTHIDVDEEGTKAAAVTVVEMNDGCAMKEPEYKTVTLDRPFVYMIVDRKTNLPVFMGAIKTLEDAQ